MGHVGVLFHRFNNVLETRVSAIRIEALSALVAIFMSFLVIFGSWRRWCTHWFIQKGVMAAYLLSFTLVTYTIGLMQSATVKVEVYPIWAACFLTVFGCTNSISAYSLDENYHIWPQVFQCILYTIYVLFILCSVADGVTFIVGFPMVIIALVKVYTRTGSFVKATRLWLYSRVATDLMSGAEDNRQLFTERGCSEEFFRESMEQEPEESMKLNPYVVSIRPKGRTYYGAPVLKFEAPNYAVKDAPEDFDVITIGKVWRECSQGYGPLQSSLYAFKDITLSYSLCQILVFRFFGYTMGDGEPAKSKNRDFVFKNLLGHRTDEDYKRVFQVIEAELAFLYDSFFTKYSSLNSRGTTVWGLASVVSLLCVMALTVARTAGTLLGPSQQASSVVTKASRSDNIITVTILAALALLEVLQMVFYWTSDWGRVAFVCQCIRQRQQIGGPNCWMRVKAFLSRIKLFSTPRYYWKQQLGQVCLFQFQTTIRPNACRGRFALAVNKCCGILEALGLPRSFLTPQATLAVWHVTVPSEVRRSVLRSLERTGDHLTNGTSSLESNQAYGLSWACMQRLHTSAEDKGSQARVILTWHIATYYCKMQLPKRQEGYHVLHDGGAEQQHVQVAMTLSQYSAYLVIYAPQLLPGHEYDTLCLFSAVSREVATFLEDKDRDEDRYEAMRRMVPDEETIFGRGVMLGKQLQEMGDVNLRWKVMADFWSEMMLYVAPSYNIKGHIEQLAQGGEFITHLWALLYHAGIVNREDYHHQVDVPLAV